MVFNSWNITALRKWTSTEVQEDFTLHSVCAPYVFVTRKSDGAEGTLEFQHSPRLYFNFQVSAGSEAEESKTKDLDSAIVEE